jgi:hypothetical protein
MGTIRGHACYKGKPMIVIQLNLSFQMSSLLQKTRKQKKTWKQKKLIVCTCYKGYY